MYQQHRICLQTTRAFEACTFSSLSTYFPKNMGLRMLVWNQNIFGYQTCTCVQTWSLAVMFGIKENLETCLGVLKKDWWTILPTPDAVDNCMQINHLCSMFELVWVVFLTPASMSAILHAMLLVPKILSAYNCSKWHMGNYCLVTWMKI